MLELVPYGLLLQAYKEEFLFYAADDARRDEWLFSATASAGSADAPMRTAHKHQREHQYAATTL